MLTGLLEGVHSIWSSEGERAELCEGAVDFWYSESGMQAAGAAGVKGWTQRQIVCVVTHGTCLGAVCKWEPKLPPTLPLLHPVGSEME